MSVDYAAHYQSIREHLLDVGRLDRAYAIDAAHRYERESFGALRGLAADVKAALTPASPTTSNTTPTRRTANAV